MVTDPAHSVPAAASVLLRFWFGRKPHDQGVSPYILERWRALGVLHISGWMPSVRADQRLTKRFGPLLGAVQQHACEDWLESVAGRLAYILLCDQLPRSIHRGTKKAFDFDPMACRAVSEGIAARHDQALDAIEQAFFFMPLIHSEEANLQREACERFALLRERATPETIPVLAVFHESALRHHRIVGHFGRFPHRNMVLGRKDTAAERAYQQDPWGWFPAMGSGG
jgi:uncharacterized protein (DUF924 family)